MKNAKFATSSCTSVRPPGAVVLLGGEVVVDARHQVVRAAVDDGVGGRAVGAVLGGEVVDHLAAGAARRGDAHLVQVGVSREVGQAGMNGLPAEARHAASARA